MVDLGVDEQGKPKWLTVIPKERHSLQVVHTSPDLSQLDAEPENTEKAPGADPV